METFRWILALGICYLIGSIPTGFWVVKCLKHTDIRTVGSGNIGATNTARAAGPWAALFVFIIDVAKGFLAVALIAPWFWGPSETLSPVLCGLATVMGHDFPVWLRFAGGKGVATTIGVLLASWPSIAAISIGVWLICFLIWRYVSVGSLVASLVIPIGLMLLHRSWAEWVAGSGLTLLMIVRHRSNIARLLEGQEHRVQRLQRHKGPSELFEG